MRIKDYQCVVFDLDGILFDSNVAKVRAARRVVSNVAPEVADAFALEFSNNFGLTRRQHFESCYASYLGHLGFDVAIVDQLIEDYAREVRTLYEGCEVCEGALELVRTLRRQDKICAVVTGGDQVEARALIERSAFRGMFQEVLGAPASKASNTFKVMAAVGAHKSHTVFIGDARQDWDSARECGAAFVLATRYSVANTTVLRDLVVRGGGRIVLSLGDLLAEIEQDAYTA